MNIGSSSTHGSSKAWREGSGIPTVLPGLTVSVEVRCPSTPHRTKVNAVSVRY